MATPLEKWVEQQAQLTKPDDIYWCNGSEEEAHRIIERGISKEKINGAPVFSKLNQSAWPNAYYHRSHPTDVARTEHLTYVCHADKETAGPNNNWMAPAEAMEKMRKLSDGCMRGRTMYVLPYMMGHPDSPYAKPCIQLTDSAYVAASMRIMTRLGNAVIDKIGARENFVKGLHSIGDLNPERRLIMHFPDEKFVWSIGSGYGGNALLGKKCFSLRIASWQGYQEGWLAEHMVVMGIEDPEGKVTYIAAALPSACGKTNLAMLQSALPGYKIWPLGDDIAWMNVGSDGRLYAINPEAGFFGVAPGTSMKTNPNMIRTLKNDKFFPTLFTNTALNKITNEPWWEGLDYPEGADMEDWQGKTWNPSMSAKAAHPNARFTTSIYNCPILSKEYDNPGGVPISAIIVGGRRAHLVPLVTEAFNWQHGVFHAARMGSETTAAAAHQIGVVRRDPMAMLPFCGYNMGDYFRHWLSIGKKMANPPKIFSVNWFRTDENGSFIWPGFGDNIRILKWIIERTNGKAGAKKTAIGFVPAKEDLDMTGLSMEPEKLDGILSVNIKDWKPELEDTKKFLQQFGERMPAEIWQEFAALEKEIGG
ncbi:MAG: phosphoenolpyruvate carboxykinase [Elusimicrobia bacterium RIFOXYA2_FULL_50_26]|nr:MAG: phosphoenolpyruvate carboxykinase [Elusimicrobia bacterium RIFOXYA2_FULL_50_26]OGS23402.1 MAG: phosphoenolpyruvate carboxykinase [Elusimicrobia bacterium RIFOXYB2_FULL_50_12]